MSKEKQTLQRPDLVLNFPFLRVPFSFSATLLLDLSLTEFLTAVR